MVSVGRDDQELMQAFEHARAASQGARPYQEDTAAIWEGAAVTSSPAADSAAPSSTSPTAVADRPAAGTRSSSLLAVLADGMGGHQGGALASKTVCETFIDAFRSEAGEDREKLVASLASANDAVRTLADQDPMLDGMGSTLIGAAFHSDGVEWVSVGDSPLLLYRRGEIATLNADHSLAPELDRLAELGSITKERAKADPRRHMLRSAITGDEIELVDVSKHALKLEPGDLIILASDGVHTLETTEIARVVSAYSDDGASAVCDALIRAVDAVRDPHQDNTTVITVRVVNGNGGV